MKIENYYFKNKIIVFYPFYFLNITKNKKYKGYNFRSLNIRHLPYYKQTVERDKPCKTLKNFFDKLLRSKFSFVDGYSGMGYSVHEFSNGNLEKKLKEINEDIELLFFILNNTIKDVDTSFPKYYIITNVSYCKTCISFYFYKEFIDLYSYQYEVMYDDDQINKKYKQVIDIKRGNLHSPCLDARWKKFFSDDISPKIYWGIYWHNKTLSKAIGELEKIIFSVFALENILNLSYQNEDSFAKEIVDELELSREDPRVCVFCSFIRQAHKLRSGIVHGLNCSSRELDFRGKCGGGKYYKLYDYLNDAFKLIIKKRITGSNISDIQKDILLNSIYPNKNRVDEFRKFIKKNKSFNSLYLLRNMRRNDSVDIDKNNLNEIILFTNEYAKKIIKKDIDSVGSLIKNDEWKKIDDLATKIDDDSRYGWVEYGFEIYYSIQGLVDFLKFLSNYVMRESLKTERKKESKKK